MLKTHVGTMVAGQARPMLNGFQSSTLMDPSTSTWGKRNTAKRANSTSMSGDTRHENNMPPILLAMPTEELLITTDALPFPCGGMKKEKKRQGEDSTEMSRDNEEDLSTTPWRKKEKPQREQRAETCKPT